MTIELVNVSRAKYVYGKRYDIRRSHTFKKEFANINELIDFLFKNESVKISDNTIKEMRKMGIFYPFLQKYNYIFDNAEVYKKITGNEPKEE